MAVLSIEGIWSIIQRADRLLENVTKLQTGQETLADRVLELERRVATLETREELLIEKMGNRASEAATAVMNSNMMDMARRLGALEERSRYMGEDATKRLE